MIRFNVKNVVILFSKGKCKDTLSQNTHQFMTESLNVMFVVRVLIEMLSSKIIKILTQERNHIDANFAIHALPVLELMLCTNEAILDIVEKTDTPIDMFLIYKPI